MAKMVDFLKHFNINYFNGGDHIIFYKEIMFLQLGYNASLLSQRISVEVIKKFGILHQNLHNHQA